MRLLYVVLAGAALVFLTGVETTSQHEDPLPGGQALCRRCTRTPAPTPSLTAAVSPTNTPTLTLTPAPEATVTPPIVATETPAATETPPVIDTPSPTPTTFPVQEKGLAQVMPYPEDRTLLGATWYHNWSFCAEGDGCIPMLRYGTEPIPACPANLLVFNEPNAVEPWGGPVTPAEAAVRVAAIEQQCPIARLIVGNVSADDWRWNGGWGRGQDWLRYFLSEYSLRYGRSFSATLGVHCFETLSGWCSTELGRMRTTYSGPMWVTEFAVVNDSPDQFTALLDYITCCGRFERYAAYTNREPESGQGWEIGRSVWLVDENGLTVKGELYSGR